MEAAPVHPEKGQPLTFDLTDLAQEGRQLTVKRPETILSSHSLTSNRLTGESDPLISGTDSLFQSLCFPRPRKADAAGCDWRPAPRFSSLSRRFLGYQRAKAIPSITISSLRASAVTSKLVACDQSRKGVTSRCAPVNQVTYGERLWRPPQRGRC